MVRGWRRRAAGAAAGIVADRILGEPPARVHPVAAFGTLMSRAEDVWWRDRRGPGAAHAAAGVAAAVAAGALLRSTAAASYVTVAGRALAEAARNAGDALVSGDLAEARRLLPALVGRDPRRLSEAEVARAVVESVAENTVDAVVAPALWAAAAGAPGGLGYRAVNTLDSMVGYRNDRYRRFGWASARLDDLAGWVPARVTAVLVAMARPRRAPAVVRAVARQAPAHPSPNAGVAEAAFAAALGVTLGGVNAYGDLVEERPRLGGGPAAAPADVSRAIRLADDVGLLLAGFLLAPAAVEVIRARRA